MLRFGMTATALFLALVVSTSVQAGALNDFLTPNNVPEFLDDDDYESLIDVTGDGISSGDIFVGMFNLSTIINETGIHTLTPATGGVKGFIVAAIDTFAGGAVTFRAVTAAEYADLRDGDLIPGGAANALSNLPASIAAGSALLVYQSPVGVPVSVDPNSDFINAEDAGTDWAAGVDGNSVNTSLASVTAGGATAAYEFGFTDGAIGTAIMGADGSIVFSLALNVTAYNDPTLPFLRDITSPQSGVVNVLGGLLPSAKIHIGGFTDADDLLSPVGPVIVNSFPTGNFFWKTDANMFVNAYPEPGSVVLLTLGGLGVVGAKLRRRKTAA